MARKAFFSLPIAILLLLFTFQVLAFLFLAPSADGIEAFKTSSSGGVTRNNNPHAKRLLHPAHLKDYSTIPHQNVTIVGVDESSSFSSRKLAHPFVLLPSSLSLVNASYHSPNFIRPAFSDIVPDHKNNVITGDLQFLLDFAIVGHAKCGTSTMMYWLGEHPQVLTRGQELPQLTLGKVGLFAKNCYHLDENGDPTKFRAYKNPTDIHNLRAIRLLREYFPQTRLFIGIRHPIRWFESFYNHRIQNTGSMPDPSKLKAGCFKDSQGVCGNRADYHLTLVRLGKTNYTNEHDAFLPGEWKGVLKDDPPYSPNPVFWYDTQQLSDPDEERSAQFRRDVQHFIGLSTPLPPVIHYSPGKDLNTTLQAERDAKKINICDSRFQELRGILLGKAKHAAFYIRKYFMHAPDVLISSPNYFVQDILDSYQRDPCEAAESQAS